MYHYKLKQQHATSDKYGPCQVCGNFCNDVYYQIEEKEFNHPDGYIALTHHKCNSLFGCKECLVNSRKN